MPFQLSYNPADVKYDIISHALDELDDAKWTGTKLTREHVAHTWRVKVIKECGQESECAKVLLSQERGTSFQDWCAAHEEEMGPNSNVIASLASIQTRSKREAEDSTLEDFGQEPAQRVDGRDSKRPKKQTAAEPKIETELAAGSDGRLVKDAAPTGKSELIPATVPAGKNAKNNQ